MINENALFNPFAGPELDYVVYTTQSQSEIWTACYLGGKDAARSYNESVSLKFNGILNSTALERSIQKLVERHESLRATFSTDGIFMSIFKKLTLELDIQDVSNFDENAKKTHLHQYLTAEGLFTFDLVQGPLIKFGLLTFSETKHQLVITAHHIICDGWSIGIMLQDLGAIYSAYVENKTPHLPEVFPFSSFANEEKTASDNEENLRVEKYWLEMYKESVPVVNLPTDHPRPSLRTFKSQRLDFSFDPDLLSHLKQTGLKVGSSLVTTMLTTFEILLYQLTGQNDLIVGMPAAGQPTLDMNCLIGHCVNLLPLRSKVNPNMSFNDYLKQRKSELFDAYDHQHLSFGQLLQKLSIARDPSRIPLVPVVFNIDIGMTDGVHFSDLTYEYLSNPKAYENFEIFLNANGTEKHLVFEWSFNTSLFKPETIQKMMLSFEQLVQKIVEDPSKTLKQITFRDYTGKNIEISGPKMDYPKSTLHELFTNQAKIHPTAIALEFGKKQMAYAELSSMTNQMAHYLRSKGLRQGQIVAISLNRTPELIVSIFAVLQCGASYIPIDPTYPDGRLNLMIEDSEASFYIGLHSKSGLAKDVISLSITNIFESMVEFSTEPLQLKVGTDAAAYIIYTSGSTGKPKGVQVAHCNAINLVYSMGKEPGIASSDKIFSITTISFDAMVMEIFLPLLHGACVVLVDEETRRDGNLLLDKAAKDKITMMWGTSSIWRILMDSGWKTPLNIKALIGGEPVPLLLAKELLARCNQVWNIYGPTETTVCSLLTQISDNDNPITIGRPIANTTVYLLDSNRNPVNEGDIGEIVIAGDGVSLGYLNRPDLNNERFVLNTFDSETDRKMYLSGDLGKLLPNGQVQCLGRIDHQVKVRGYRIELGEIEQALLAIDGIKGAIVLAETDLLVAFIEADYEITDQKGQIRSWRNELASQLPAFMVPYEFHLLHKFPTTLSGKIDRKALSNHTSNQTIPYNEPRTEAEKIVETIWKECLNRQQIDIFSNFFEIGGHSLTAVRVMNKIEQKTRTKLPLSTLFEHSTIEKFAKLLEKDTEVYSDCIVPIKPNGTKVPLFIVHGAGLNVLNFVNIVKHFDEQQPVYGLQGTSRTYDHWYDSIEDMAGHYIDAIVKINPTGPYALAGFSFGGVVAYEMTRQLKEQGKTVSLTALLDSYVDSSYYYRTHLQKKMMRYYDVNRRRFDFLKEMLSSWAAFKHRINVKKDYILKQHFSQNSTLSEEEALALEQFTAANAMVQKIVDRYHLQPQNFEVDLFRAENDDSYKLDPVHLGWKKVALKGVTIHNIPGDHLDIVVPPNDKVLARMLQEILDTNHLKNLN